VPGVEPAEQLLGHLVGRQVEVDPAVANTDDAGKVAQREIHAVQVHQEGLPRLVGQVAEQGDDGHRQRRVHRGHGLVRQNDGRILDQDAGQGHALLLPAR
jgi:hypothetical protein